MLSLSYLKDMNTAIKTVVFKQQLLKIAFFHSTSVLERKRSSSSSNCLFSNVKMANAYKKYKRSKKFLREHQETIRRAVEELKRIQEEASRKPKESKENRNYKSNYKSSYTSYKDKDYEFESIREEEWWHHSSWIYNECRNSWRSKYRYYKGEQEEEDGSVSMSVSVSESKFRQTLGLSLTSTLNLDTVKDAYRKCALQWHPDRHNESTKKMAEDKFKLCTVAYQSLIKMLPLN